MHASLKLVFIGHFVRFFLQDVWSCKNINKSQLKISHSKSTSEFLLSDLFIYGKREVFNWVEILRFDLSENRLWTVGMLISEIKGSWTSFLSLHCRARQMSSRLMNGAVKCCRLRKTFRTPESTFVRRNSSQIPKCITHRKLLPLYTSRVLDLFAVANGDETADAFSRKHILREKHFRLGAAKIFFHKKFSSLLSCWMRRFVAYAIPSIT